MKFIHEAFVPWSGFGFGVNTRHDVAFFQLFRHRLSLMWRTRVLCHKCGQPATIKCIYRLNDSVSGLDYARDPLCGNCGQIGPCPDLPKHQEHVPIPKEQLMAYWRD